MDLLSSLNQAQWKSEKPDNIQGLIEYTVLKCKPLKKAGEFEYALKTTTEEGVDMTVGVLEGGQGKRNPLQQARNVQMKIQQGKILAINLDGDCVAKK